MENLNNLKVLQLIDSLEIGGQERMAVTFANELSDKICFSGLIVTREEGDLIKEINNKVSYCFLNKKNKIDLKAILKLRKFLKTNKIDIIHAHGSSYFLAVLTKITFTKVKLFWHDHNGNRLNVKNDNLIIRISSVFFKGIFTVNRELENWAKEKLFCKSVNFIPNCVSMNESLQNKITVLKGPENKRIVCLANLKNPKNHLFLLKSFYKSAIFKYDWTLHLIGKDFNDSYSDQLKEFIVATNLQNYVFIYGSCVDVKNILSQSNIGVLISTYEGFPVTLLEYGLSNLAVIASNVGYCNEIIKDNETGLLFLSNNEEQFINNLIKITNDTDLRSKLSQNLNELVNNNYSANSICNLLMQYYYN